MGPKGNKNGKLHVSYAEKLKLNDYFEYRYFTDGSGNYYYFNPYTGETIFNTDFSLMDRSKSMWAPVDKSVADYVTGLWLYPEYYASRRWGRRKVQAFDEESAATHICAVARGFLARLALKQYFKARYGKILCEFSGYYYYFDTYYPNADPSWYKPRLAFPSDIGLYSEIAQDKENYMKGTTYSSMSILKGPFCKKSGVGRKAVTRVDAQAFLIQSSWRDAAVDDPLYVDIDTVKLYDTIPFYDGSDVISLYLSEEAYMRCVVAEKDWTKTLQHALRYENNEKIIVSAMNFFASTPVPLNGDDLSSISKEVYLWASDVISNPQFSRETYCAALLCFHNIFSIYPGRKEFLSISHINEVGLKRQTVIEEYLIDLFFKFVRFIDKIPVYTHRVLIRHTKDFDEVILPEENYIRVVDLTLTCLGDLAHDLENKELLTEVIVDYVIEAMEVCITSATCIISGMRCMYNLMYRCESAQMFIRKRTQFCSGFLDKVRIAYETDHELIISVRKVELSLEDDGWRGIVEKQIDRELAALKDDESEHKVEAEEPSEVASYYDAPQLNWDSASAITDYSSV